MGEETLEWRIANLEKRVDAIEGKINATVALLLVNLGGIVAILAKVVVFGKP